MPHKRNSLDLAGPPLWYVVGLITSDGCLSSDGRHIDITAKERAFLEKVRKAIGVCNPIGVKNKGRCNEAYRLVFSNRNLYEFLLSVGLTPKKSLTLHKVIVPDEFFYDFLRGVIDGDGCIRSWVHPTNHKEQWSLRIYSSSPFFVGWLRREIEQIARVTGRLHCSAKERPQAGLYVLTYGKLAAQKILGACYYDGALSLDRKARLAEKCCASSVRWMRSKTVLP